MSTLEEQLQSEFENIQEILPRLVRPKMQRNFKSKMPQPMIVPGPSPQVALAKDK
jgi:hypothetical protein